MRETRPSGSEGGATELNQSFLPLSFARIASLIYPPSFFCAFAQLSLSVTARLKTG